MLARRAFDSHMIVMIAQAIKDYATVGDYDRAKDQASDQIISRQSRGSVSTQNNWYMDEKEFDSLSNRALKAMIILRKAASKAKSYG